MTSDLLNMSRVIVNQKAKLVELTNEYKLLDEQGNMVGTIRQKGQSAILKVLRALTNIDPLLTVHLEVFDDTGGKVLDIFKPRALFRASVRVSDGAGTPIGSIKIQIRVGKARFTISDSSGHQLGEMRAEDFKAWNFSITDSTATEVARVNKKWSGLGKELFTTADNYVIELQPELQGDLRSLAFASAVAIDTVLKQYKG